MELIETLSHGIIPGQEKGSGEGKGLLLKDEKCE